MQLKKIKSTRWDVYAVFLLAFYALVQLLRWSIVPQSMDIHYHLLTAWGFFRSGGYVGWDFWQYAPVGRVHIYPPLFHLILAPFIALDVNKVTLAKSLEAGMPFLFMLAVWRFTRRNYWPRLAFFVLVAAGSSLSFYFSLSGYLAATLATILGLASIDRVLRDKILHAALFLALCFYTHIGTSWFFAAVFISYGVIERQRIRQCLLTLGLAVAFSLPVLFKQLFNLRYISLAGINQGYFCEFKLLEYAVALFAVYIAFRYSKRYSLFLAFLPASLVFVPYPYRLFSAQGYLAVVFLLAAAFDFLASKLENKGRVIKSLFALLLAAMMIFSPTLVMEKAQAAGGKAGRRICIFDSAFVGNMLPGRNRRVVTTGDIWIPNAYVPIADLIRANSGPDEIIYTTLPNAGMCLASLSGRATANGLLPEIAPIRAMNPFLAAKIVVFLNDDDPQQVRAVVEKYRLDKLGANKLFTVYNNPSCRTKLAVRKAALPFGVIGLIALAFLSLFFFTSLRHRWGHFSGTLLSR